jgi:hypothetical protein
VNDDSVTLLLALEKGPVPIMVTAATRNVYVPLDSVTVALVADDAERETVVQLLPLFVEYWI